MVPINQKSLELVSVVIPAFNADEYLQEALHGVISQIHENWELIVIEDGSITNAEAIVAEVARSQPNKRIVFERLTVNLGQAAARNVAINLSHGSFIALLDSDDIWLPTHLAAAIEKLDQTRADIVYSTSVLLDGNAHQVLGTWGPSSDELRKFPISLLTRNFITPSSTVLRKSVFERVGYFNEDRHIQGVEDFDLWLRAIREQIAFEYLGGVHCLYRKGHESAATSTSNMHLMTQRITQVLEKYVYSIPSLKTRDANLILAESYRTAAYNNIQICQRYSLRAYWNSWKLNPFSFSTSVFLLASLVGYVLPQVPVILKKYNTFRHTRMSGF